MDHILNWALGVCFGAALMDLHWRRKHSAYASLARSIVVDLAKVAVQRESNIETIKKQGLP